MPIYLRRFYFKKLIDAKKEESKQIKESQSKIKTSKNINNPSSRFKR